MEYLCLLLLLDSSLHKPKKVEKIAYNVIKFTYYGNNKILVSLLNDYILK
jgi:hypothetical protein